MQIEIIYQGKSSKNQGTSHVFLIYDARLSKNDPSHLSKENFHTWISTLKFVTSSFRDLFSKEIYTV